MVAEGRTENDRRGAVNEAGHLFDTDGALHVPTDLARGIWSPDSLHGGAVSALVAELLLESVTDGFRPARFMTTLLRPVPYTALQFEVTPIRRGRRVEALAGLLSCRTAKSDRIATTLLAHGTLLAVHAMEEPPPSGSVGLTPTSQPTASVALVDTSFVGDGIEIRYIVDDSGGTPSAWLRLRATVRPGHQVEPLIRVAAAADLTGGVAVRRGTVTTRSAINADVTVELIRDPVGEWIRLAAEPLWGATGFGYVRAAAFDELGVVGSTSSVLLDQPASRFESWSPRTWKSYDAAT
jgi:hypothetical protein